VNKFKVPVKYADTKEHLPDAEQKNRLIKECAHAKYYWLPFTHLKRHMVKVLVAESSKKLN
jgi:hypothetical protein